jgi:riboflavin kinase / FMN adenylyltransferase
MAIFTDIDHLPAFRNAVITVGTFDGVHQGHKAILREVVNHAREVDGESALLTFEPHPRKLLFPDHPLGIITPLSRKMGLITAEGISNIVVVPFTREFAAMSAAQYIEDLIVRYFHPHSIIIGHDHRFGHDRRGDIGLLREFAGKFSYNVTEIPAQLIDEAAVSSTKVRHALMAGHVAEAAQMLGRNYELSGMVVHGNKLGRTLGYPTANIHPDDADQLIPGNGIYAVRVGYKGNTYGGMMSVGYNPTVSDKHELRLEVNIFNFDQDIYGDTITVSFVSKLRDEQKFSGIDALTTQLHADKQQSLAILF